MSKLKICLISGVISRSGGTERVGIIIANHLKSIGYDVEYLSFWNEGLPYFDLSEDIQLNYLLSKKEGKLFRTLFYPISKLRKYFKKNNYDLVISIDIILNKYTLPALKGLKTKHISWEHFNYEYEVTDRERRKSLERIKKYKDNLLVLTKSDKEMMIKQGNISEKQVFQIYNPAIPNTLESCKVSSKKVISIGRLTDQKNYLNLLRIWKIVETQIDDWELEIYGDGEEKSILELKAEQLELKRITFKGVNPNISKVILDSSIYVMTSKYEGFPMVLLEAISAGLPVISYNIKTGPDEIITDGENGFLVEYSDTKSFAEKLLLMMNNETIRERFSEKALEKAKDFSIDSIIENWVFLINEIVKGNTNENDQ